MIMAERVRKDSEPFVEQISDKKKKFRYADVKIDSWFWTPCRVPKKSTKNIFTVPGEF